MSEPVRSHRRASPVVDGLVVGGLIIGLLLALVLLRIAAFTVDELFGGVGFLVVVTVIGGVAAVRAWLRSSRGLRAHDELRHWERTAGWEPAAWRWPWQGLVRWAETVTVLRAYAKRVEGFPVRVGELEFDDNGLGTAVDRRSGRAAFAIVGLARPVPSMGVRVRRQPPRLRAGEDEFRHRFAPVGLDADRLADPALRAAHVRGDIPPWTAIGDELFVFVPLDGPLRPRDLDEAARRAILAVRLLKLDAGGSAVAGSPVEVGEDG